MGHARARDNRDEAQIWDEQIADLRSQLDLLDPDCGGPPPPTRAVPSLDPHQLPPQPGPQSGAQSRHPASQLSSRGPAPDTRRAARGREYGTRARFRPAPANRTAGAAPDHPWPMIYTFGRAGGGRWAGGAATLGSARPRAVSPITSCCSGQACAGPRRSRSAAGTPPPRRQMAGCKPHRPPIVPYVVDKSAQPTKSG